MTTKFSAFGIRPALLLTLLCVPASAPAKPRPDRWVGTWTAANQDRPNPKPDFGAQDTTLRQIVHVSLAGSLIRIELSNEFGTEPLKIGQVHIALADAAGDLQLTTANALSFGGHPAIAIPPGATAVSDPVSLALPAFADLAISIFIPAQKISHISTHNSAYQTNFMAAGNQVGQRTLTGAKKFISWFFLKAVDVKVSAADASVVALGDSITDGTFSTPDKNLRWPDLLAQRLHADKRTAGLGVLNVGIGGNRVLHDGTGPSALARFDRDVLGQSGVKYLIVLESINDIGHAYDPRKPYDVVSAEDLIAGLTQIVERAHNHGIKVFGATVTPYMGAGYSSPAGETVRQTVNHWIRTGNAFDGVIDFDDATRDSSNPAALAPAFDHGDHLHPNDAGMKAMAGSINLKLFTER